ncbi:helix-turn-helix domain-containing protein [Lactobacillus amylovorus]|uniref:helix-turn-helix domain-containing protein n=1 Tax=Lactobacillus amylovorus TaxID=1604 RepID=UPI00232B6184|nr:helix-turn-helix transcriptional regulator [Lactobacillus amylovorus]MDB6234009.1 helix-turn-helix domain-containing protein [Lactobacillus amylovorus]
MKIGQKLKMVRLSLGMNRKEFVKGVIDNSYLASVENGESDIRVTSLINILQKIIYPFRIFLKILILNIRDRKIVCVRMNNFLKH